MCLRRASDGGAAYRKQPHAVLLAALAFGFALAVLAALAFCPGAFAASGKVYSCTIVPSYKHPYTGEVEDSAGASSQATGQAMVESCLSSKGMLEITDSGNYYLTLRLSLIDYTRDQTFQVQEWGTDSWTDPKLGVTATGKDSNGTTNDVCIQVPSQKTIVRIAMYVESMGRDVVFFCYPKHFEGGTPKGFTATRVTSSSQDTASGKSDSKASKQNAKKDESKASKNEDAKNESSDDAGDGTESSAATDPQTGAKSASDADELVGNSVTSNAQGLSLSTAVQTEDGTQQGQAQTGDTTAQQVTPQQTTPQQGFSVGESILVNIVSVAGSGLILIAAAAGVVYLFRRNWKRWGGDDPDDYDEWFDDDEQ